MSTAILPVFPMPSAQNVAERSSKDVDRAQGVLQRQVKVLIENLDDTKINDSPFDRADRWQLELAATLDGLPVSELFRFVFDFNPLHLASDSSTIPAPLQAYPASSRHNADRIITVKSVFPFALCPGTSVPSSMKRFEL